MQNRFGNVYIMKSALMLLIIAHLNVALSIHVSHMYLYLCRKQHQYTLETKLCLDRNR